MDRANPIIVQPVAEHRIGPDVDQCNREEFIYRFGRDLRRSASGVDLYHDNAQRDLRRSDRPLVYRADGPAARRRSRLALTLSEREEISRGLAAHRSCRLMRRDAN